jgi:glycerol uptake facilitator-like aquaporin
MSTRNKLLAEFVGTALLLMVVLGSGIYGETLSNGNTAVALLANSIATGAGLYVLISLLGPISGAHFNPVVSVYAYVEGMHSRMECVHYIIAQCTGAVAGVWLTHMIYAMPVLQTSAKHRTGLAQWVSELVATALLLGAIHLASRYAKEKIALIVALLVTAGYWFTSSTFFANPAVTLARSLSNSFAGIAPQDVIGFMAAQVLGLSLFFAIKRVLTLRAPEPH